MVVQCTKPSDAGSRQRPVMGENRAGRTQEPKYTYAPMTIGSCEIRVGNAASAVAVAKPPTISGGQKR